jgi:predicted metalloprotease
MRWTPGDRSNVEDYRGRTGLGLGGGLGIGGLLLLLVLSWATGTNFFSLLTSTEGVPPEAIGTSGRTASSPAEEREVDFVDAVMKDVQENAIPSEFQMAASGL